MTASVEVTIEGKGANLVLLHGWGLNSGVWQTILPELSQNFCVHMIDLPGFGVNSEILPEKYDLRSICHLITPFIPNNSIVLGWSLGGLVAQYLAIHQPEKVIELLLVASSPKFVESKPWLGIKPNVLNVFEQQLEADFHKTLSRFLSIQALGSPSAKQDIMCIKQAIETYPEPNIVALREGLTLLNGIDFRAELASINVLTRLLFGRLDSLIPVKNVPNILGLYREVSHHIVEHASHAPFISHPTEFVDWVNLSLGR